MQAAYIARRFGVFLLIVWLAASLNFFLPRLSGQDPVRTKLLQQAALGGYVQGGIDEMTKEYERRFGLDKPLWRQYLSYLDGVAHLDFNYSIANYPRRVSELIADALPWTLALLGTTTLLSFAIGSFLGALLAWPGAPRWMRWLMPPLWALHAIPFFLLGLILTYLLAFQIPLLPIFGGYSAGALPALSWRFATDVLQHALLPALSIILVATGGWALGMRGMMVTNAGEDYIILARAKGLSASRLFLRYAVRNAVLPQVTALALTLGSIVGGATLVEYLFAYPGMGYLLYQAIVSNDYTVIEGVVFILVLTTATAVLLIDLVYPLIDPRISYQQR